MKTPLSPLMPNYKQSPPHKQKTKKVLGSNRSGIFHRKKSHVDGGSSSSYLPGEKPVYSCILDVEVSPALSLMVAVGVPSARFDVEVVLSLGGISVSGFWLKTVSSMNFPVYFHC
ncbi:hypothetical protein Tco_0484274, partial [Tanacetum coccineum]